MSLREVLNSVYLDARGDQEFNEIVVNFTVDLALSAIKHELKEKIEGSRKGGCMGMNCSCVSQYNKAISEISAVIDSM